MKLLLSIGLAFTLLNCNTQKIESNTSTMSEYTGLLQPQGMTSYQYGTHTLETENSFYALKSETVNLDTYIDKIITITAEPIEGYPLDAGPEYLNVISIKK